MLRSTLDPLSRKSDPAAAILYELKLLSALLRYCDHGAIEIDNSAAERALRGVAIGRNYLFASADSGGERAAAIYPLLGTVKPPIAWLRHVLTHTADHPVIGLMISRPGPATCQQPFDIMQFPSGVMPSSIKTPLPSRRR